MKVLLLIITMTFTTTHASALELLCSGEQYSEYSGRLSFNFNMTIDFNTNEISIIDSRFNEGVVIKNPLDLYGKDSCPKQKLSIKIDKLAIWTRAECRNGEIDESLMRTWKINRSDGSFVTSGVTSSGKGKCVKASERAF